MTPSNPIDYFAIKNTLSLYCIALDSKDFGLLEQVFTEDVDAKYPFATLKRLRNLADAIQKRLAPITSQHALTTQTVSIAADGKTAEAVTYFTGIHFGQGSWKGQEVTVWGKYVDTLILLEGNENLPGASGQWLIGRREAVFMGRLGEERVMEGE
ncbi:hypothetical protein DL769_000615 [Monosporascus sp. CRB-8-3]|nr:hypothetical protein DL769_000615 [Monosporascus sp. CRB-8-3]